METVSGFFQEFSCSIHRVVHFERWWYWVRMMFLTLSSVSDLPGLAVLLITPSTVCSLERVRWHTQSAGSCIGGFLLGISDLEASEQAGLAQHISRQVFWISWFASTILSANGSIKVLHLHRVRGFGKSTPDATKHPQRQVLLSFPHAPWASQSIFDRVDLRTKAAVLHKAYGIPSFLLSNEWCALLPFMECWFGWCGLLVVFFRFV